MDQISCEHTELLDKLYKRCMRREPVRTDIGRACMAAYGDYLSDAKTRQWLENFVLCSPHLIASIKEKSKTAKHNEIYLDSACLLAYHIMFAKKENFDPDHIDHPLLPSAMLDVLVDKKNPAVTLQQAKQQEKNANNEPGTKRTSRQVS